MAGDMGSLRANRGKAETPPPAIETRRCDGCNADFWPARLWSRFCYRACRLWAHRRFAGNTTDKKLAAIFESDPRQTVGRSHHRTRRCARRQKNEQTRSFSDPKTESAL